VGDTQVVGHIGMPRDLADYVQESRRAGQDRAPSESVVLLPSDVLGDRAGQKRCQVSRELTGLYPRARDVSMY
jgi:superfamily II DNA helicase RecQ